MSTVKIRRSGTTTSTPSSLDHGELAINYADAKLFWKDATNTIRSFVFQAYASATHKSQHATGGSDALSPSDIGAAALSGATFTGAVEFDRTVANSSATALVVDGNFSTTSNAEVVTLGVFSDVRKTVSSGVTDSGKLFGGQFDAVADGDGTLAEAYGVYARAVNLGEGNLTTATAIYAHVIGGTTGYGVYIAAGSATTSWGVYQAGGEKNYFGGNVGIGVSPTSALHVNGTVDCDGLIVGTTTASATGISLLGAADAAAARTTLGAAPAASPTFTGTVTVSATSGSAGSYAPSLTFSGDANTGFGQVSGQSDTASIFTAGHERVRVRSDGNVGIGSAGGSNAALWIQPTLSSASDRYGIYGRITGTTDSTSPIYTCSTFADLHSSASTSLAVNYQAIRPQLAAGASVTTAVGLLVQSSFTVATNNYGVQLSIGSGSGRWNIYADGTAANYFAGNVGIGSGTTSPTAALDINADKIRLRTAKTPASASDTGNAGDICWDASYLYICTATNTWRRIAHSTW